MSISSILPIDRTQSGATTPGQRRPRSYGNEWVLHIPEISMARASQSDGVMSYPRHSFGGVLNHLEICSWCIQQPRPARLSRFVHHAIFSGEISPEVMTKVLNLTHRCDPTRYQHSGHRGLFLTWLTNAKYSCLTQKYFKHIYLTHRFDSISESV